MTTKASLLPRDFIWRRLHSLMGLWLVIFLFEHLLTNSQAALWLGDNGKGFVKMVNLLHDLPYLQVIELTLIGIPFGIHMIWGVRYALVGKSNVKKGDGSKPSLRYGRNRAYSWQRITSWILLVILVVHVVKFRFLEYPHTVNSGATPTYFARVNMDSGLYTVADRLGVKLYDPDALCSMQKELGQSSSEMALTAAAEEIRERGDSSEYSQQDALILQSAESYKEKRNLYEGLSSIRLKQNQVVVASSSFGTTSLFTVRDTFKNPWWVALYTVFVLAAVFHAFNGLWTCMLTWGWMIRYGAQKGALKFCIGLMLLLGFLGLAAVWGTYYVNLRM